MAFTMEMAVDIFLFLLFFSAAFYMAQKGFYNLIMPVAVFLSALGGAAVLATILTGPISHLLIPKVSASIASRLELRGSVASTVDGAVHSLDNVLPGWALNAMDQAGIADSAQQILKDTGESAQNALNHVTRAVAQAVAESLVPQLLRVVLFLLGSVALLLLLTVLKNMMHLAVDLPVIKQLDTLGGAALGILECALVVWIALWILRRFGVTYFETLAKNTYLLRWFTQS